MDYKYSPGIIDFIQDIKLPVEPMGNTPAPFVPSATVQKKETEVKGESSVDDLFGEPDEPSMSGAADGEGDDSLPFDYLESHLQTAEFLLIQLDKFMSFGMYLFSGADEWDKYRIRKEKNPYDDKSDYEMMALASILKKHQLKLSVEIIFITAIGMAYAGAGAEAFKDRKEKKRQAKPEAKTDSKSDSNKFEKMD